MVLVLGWRGAIYEITEGNYTCGVQSGDLGLAARGSSGPGVLCLPVTLFFGAGEGPSSMC